MKSDHNKINLLYNLTFKQSDNHIISPLNIMSILQYDHHTMRLLSNRTENAIGPLYNLTIIQSEYYNLTIIQYDYHKI